MLLNLTIARDDRKRSLRAVLTVMRHGSQTARGFVISLNTLPKEWRSVTPSAGQQFFFLIVFSRVTAMKRNASPSVPWWHETAGLYDSNRVTRHAPVVPRRLSTFALRKLESLQRRTNRHFVSLSKRPRALSATNWTFFNSLPHFNVGATNALLAWYRLEMFFSKSVLLQLTLFWNSAIEKRASMNAFYFVILLTQ